ncbi:MAG: enoyl-CoA hydratase/isomerase family protein [Actinomycetota bacterium]
MIDFTRDGELAIVRFNNPPVNALGPEFMEEIIAGIDEAERSDARALIVTGEGIAFSAGADLFRVFDASREDLAGGIATMSRMFERLFRFPKPTVAAVNGHAIAGGAVLACACDYRVTSEGTHRIGFSELAVGVPFPRWALEILRFAVGAEHVRDLALVAATFSVDDAVTMGMIDEIVPAANLMGRAAATARRLARVPSETYALTKAALLKPAVENVERLGQKHDEDCVDLWASGEVQSAIRAFLDRTVGKASR